MIRNKTLVLIFVLTFLTGNLFAQDLMDMLKDSTPQKNFTYAAFKTTRIILGQSIENPAAGTLQFAIEHNFNALNQGSYNLWGLDGSTIRFGLEYGINDKLSVGLGRSSYEKTYDASLKYKIIRQSTGKNHVPISISYYGEILYNTLKIDPAKKDYASSRVSYVSQLLFARKCSNALSLQMTPTYIHKNLVSFRSDDNNLFSLGLGGRYKITQRTSINAEYYFQIPGYVNSYLNVDGSKTKYTNYLGIGLDVETGGHVFQFRLSNAQPMFDRAFISETSNKWTDKGIFLGFTINRVFSIAHPKVKG